MSVAVSPYLTPPQILGYQHEQHTDLLDALLASCHKSAMNPRLPGYGRNLQPYFTTEIVAPRIESPAPVILKGKGKSRKSKERSSNPSSSDEETTQKITKTPAKPAITRDALPDLSQGQTIKAIHKHTKAGPVAGFTWAGPAFGMAPAASEIPLPSDFLLV